MTLLCPFVLLLTVKENSCADFWQQSISVVKICGSILLSYVLIVGRVSHLVAIY